jgi:hypothetical protein
MESRHMTFILLFTLHKNCLLFLWHILLAFIVIPRNASMLLPFRHPFEFFLFLFAPYTNVFCSSVQNTVLTSPKKRSAVNWNFKWILKILLSLVCLLELCQESLAFMLHKYSHRVHWRHSQFSETDSWGIGYKYLVKKKFMHCMVLKKKALRSLKISDTSCTIVHCHISEDFQSSLRFNLCKPHNKATRISSGIPMVGVWGVQTPPKILKFWQSSAKFLVLWKIHP